MDIDKSRCNYKILYIQLYQHLEDMHYLMNLNFPNHQWVMLQNCTWAKDPFKGRKRLKSTGLLNEDVRACERRIFLGEAIAKML